MVCGFIGCDEDHDEGVRDAYIAGEIINPENRYIVFSKNNEVFDTVPLNKENRFNYEVKNVENDSYFLQHGSERQFIYLTPGDSILVHVNTLNFDESLYFSGEGSKKNNFLINMFLLNEKNTDLILSYYKIEPQIFARKTDSIRAERIKSLEKLDEKYEFSEDFDKLAKNIIDYEYYDLRERYTFLVNKYYDTFSDKYPEDFYDYREKANFNEKELQTNPSYLRFLENYLVNKSIADCRENHPEKERDCFNLNDIENIKTRIKLADSLTDLPLVKKYFLGKLGAQGIIMGKSRAELVSLIDLFREKGMNEEKLFELRQLGTIQMAFFPGADVGNAPLIDSNEKAITVAEISSKPTILFFWSIYSPAHHKEEHKIIDEMRKKYPEISFIGLNIDLGQTSQWINALRKYDYDMDKEVQLGLMELGGKPLDPFILKNYLNKLLFLDASGKVIIGDAYLYSPEFESRVLEFLNR